MSAPTILVVEDDPMNRELMTELLTAAGYQTCEAHNGETAITLTQRVRPHLILMDLGLPGVDGIQTTQRLKADPVLRSIPIVVVTAHTEIKKALATAAGCDAFLSKPINRQMLLEVIARFIT